ncbi:hypothetical protein RHIZ_07635 [Rhizobium skierniewicense]|uniref:YecR family lipoprotein n=1 Tax=Rhizobium skierniewicense TaxID=984260 RepID=UPI0013AF7B5F|nr:YecR family lipoprotein [Rhizobium skierniewicense]MCI9865809.1 hypothetical protein [Rhizobium skierniewicense]
MKIKIIAAAALLAVVGCVQVNKELVATGGSRADGTVDLSYEQASIETVKLDPAKGLVTARERCVAWGYKDASPFGGESRQCQVSNQYGCAQWLATIRYQCLGEMNQSNAKL